jgi:prepilin-type N-terminal cleavage/methylation domain-containing protein
LAQAECNILSKRGSFGRGFTLIELLVVIGIIMILITGMIKVAQSVQVKAKIKNTKSTISLLCAAMEEYRDVRNTGSDFSFPNGNPADLIADLIAALTAYLGGSWLEGDLTSHSPSSASIEFLYLCLENVSECRAMLNRLGSDVTSNADNDWVVEKSEYGAPIQRPLMEVNDAWGHPLRYQWQGDGNFPLISSAGEDGVFNTADDIISSEL